MVKPKVVHEWRHISVCRVVVQARLRFLGNVDGSVVSRMKGFLRMWNMAMAGHMLASILLRVWKSMTMICICV